MAVEANNKNKFGVILLAAGASTRLGQPKQLLMFGDLTLLDHCIHVAHGSNADSIIVVVGAKPHSVNTQVSDKTHIANNVYWQEGMSSSIRLGIKTLAEVDPLAEGAILMVCDQPYVTSLLLNTLIATYQTTGKPIVASGYDNTFGPPAFFHKKLFPELLQLDGDVGAKAVVQQHADEVELVLFPQGNIDIDTVADYQKLLKESSA
jgi:molybdenum cofactor cytidylyltransferase